VRTVGVSNKLPEVTGPSKACTTSTSDVIVKVSYAVSALFMTVNVQMYGWSRTVGKLQDLVKPIPWTGTGVGVGVAACAHGGETAMPATMAQPTANARAALPRTPKSLRRILVSWSFVFIRVPLAVTIGVGIWRSKCST
jgi:hypothetical protein